jgi:carboxymethylenebutenolidase
MVHTAQSDESWAGPAIAAYSDAITVAGGQVAVLDDYADSEHAFFNDARPEVYQAANASLAWERTVAFLRACGD